MKNFEHSKCLASLAVFRVLYNDNKDIYSIINKFIYDIICADNLKQFTVTEMSYLLKEKYDFKIPEAVISSSIKKMRDSISKDNKQYIVNKVDCLSLGSDVDSSYQQCQANNKKIFSNLIKYVEEKKDKLLSENEKEQLVDSFCNFMIDENIDTDYSSYIGAFILFNEKNSEFTECLNTIKQGVVLYTGIKYNDKVNELGNWNTKLTIYLEMEQLFHFAGYNGELFKMLFEDFYNLVKEVNHKREVKGEKKLINIKYFKGVRHDIDCFFNKAENIIEKNEAVDYSKTAMVNILKGCHSKSDVVLKKSEFETLLKSNSFLIDDNTDFFNTENYEYNIEDAQIEKVIREKINNDPYPSLNYLNCINILREGVSNCGFDNIGYILLSGNSNTLKIAFLDDIKPNGNVPLATSLSFMTNKLWFKLNKGFGDGKYPKTFDVLTKAQIVLSSQLNEKVSVEFDNLKVKFKSGKLNKEVLLDSLSELKTRSRNPEDINCDNISEVLNDINYSEIEIYLREKELKEQHANKIEIENKELALENNKQKNDFSIASKKKEDEILSLKKKNINDKIVIIQHSKTKAESKSEKRFLKERNVVIFIFIIICIVCICLIFRFSWNVIEPIVFILGIVPPFCLYVYMVIYLKEFNLLNIIKKRKELLTKIKYEEYDVNLDLLEQLKKELNEIK